MQQPILLGGPGIIVQIDESLMRRAKYHRGRQLLRTQQWVFGAYDTVNKVGFLRLVPMRDANTLMPIITQHIAPGSIIVSDRWRAYAGIPRLGIYQYESVDHSRHFRDPVTGANTNSIEGYWNRTKRKFKQMIGFCGGPGVLASYLDERMWRDRFGVAKDRTLH